MESLSAQRQRHNVKTLANWAVPILSVDYTCDYGKCDAVEDVLVVIPNLCCDDPIISPQSGERKGIRVANGSNNDMMTSHLTSKFPLPEKPHCFLKSVAGNNSCALHQSYFGVFDGHGGYEAALFLQTYLHHALANHELLLWNASLALRETIVEMGQLFIKSTEYSCVGRAAVVGLLRKKELYIAWVGNSQAVCFRSMSADQKTRYSRLTSTNAPVGRSERDQRGWQNRTNENTWSKPHTSSVNEQPGSQQRSKSKGDLRKNNEMLTSEEEYCASDAQLKPMVTLEPQVVSMTIEGTENYLILASSVFWSSLTAEMIDVELRGYIEKRKRSMPYCDHNVLAHGSACHLVKCAYANAKASSTSNKVRDIPGTVTRNGDNPGSLDGRCSSRTDGRVNVDINDTGRSDGLVNREIQSSQHQGLYERLQRTLRRRLISYSSYGNLSGHRSGNVSEVRCNMSIIIVFFESCDFLKPGLVSFLSLNNSTKLHHINTPNDGGCIGAKARAHRRLNRCVNHTKLGKPVPDIGYLEGVDGLNHKFGELYALRGQPNPMETIECLSAAELFDSCAIKDDVTISMPRSNMTSARQGDTLRDNTITAVRSASRNVKRILLHL